MEPPVIPQEIIRAANQDHWTRHRAKRQDNRVALVCDGAVVGFYTPHRSARGELRIGPVWVLPAYRNRGLVSAVYASIPGPALAFIEDGNEASVSLHKKAGFVPLRPCKQGWFWRRA